MTDLIKRDDALPAVTVETCWKCQGIGMVLGDGGDPCICNDCKYDGVVPVATDPAAIREAALQARIEELEERNKELTLQLLAVHGQAADALDKAVVAEAKLTKAEEERDGYLAERNKFQLYLQRTHADLELEVAAVEALNAKLTKTMEVLRECQKALRDHMKQYPHMAKGYTVDAEKKARAVLAELEGK